MKVLIVGLNPSRKHGDSPTLKTLYKWLDSLGLGFVSFVNLYEDYEVDYKAKKIQYIKDISEDYDRVIALGNQVSDSLKSMAIDHFKLPHPSGLNRKINDPKFVHETLEACKNYLYRGTNEIFPRS